MVYHRYGDGFRILDRRDEKYDDKTSTAGETTSTPMAPCYEVLNMVGKEGVPARADPSRRWHVLLTIDRSKGSVRLSNRGHSTSPR
jgi:hypothetical protein